MINNNNTLVSGNSVGRVNNLLSRMLDNRSATTTIAPAPSNLRCNLFGIRLDHDQLKQEMSSLLQEQLDIQQTRWGFDFENAQPTMKKSSNIKWKKCIVKRDENNTDVIDQAENNRKFLPIMINDDIELGSSVPQFYQTQRKYKLAENKNKVNQMNVVIKPEAKLIVKSKDCESAATTVAAPTVIKTKQTKLKFNDENSSRRQVETTNVSSPVKPAATSSSARKPRSLKRLDSTVRIITYSENRKDTLRSATRSTSSHTKAPITTTTTMQSNVRLSASVQSLPQSTKSAFSTPSSKQQAQPTQSTMKQASLLDMLKQKKRRQVNTNSSSKDVNKSNESTASGHFLRSHSASTTSRT